MKIGPSGRSLKCRRFVPLLVNVFRVPVCNNLNVSMADAGLHFDSRVFIEQSNNGVKYIQISRPSCQCCGPMLYMGAP